MDNLTKDQRKLNMSLIRSKNTKLEQSFFNLLNKNNIPFKQHPKIYGNPDCQIGKKFLVFVDSDFWHGWHFFKWKNRMPKEYWLEKINKNISRDKSKFLKLRKAGYRLIRVWEHSLQNDERKIIKNIRKNLKIISGS